MTSASTSSQGAPSTDPVTAAQQQHIEDLCKAGPVMEGASLIVVSNRLPVTIKVDPSVPGGYTFTLSSGGLVSALSGCKKTMNFTWIGWPGLSVPPKDEEYIEKRLREEYSCQPVWISDEIADRHYNGFSNSILWPLFHYHPGEMNFDETNWLAYREANLRFAEKIRSIVRQGDMVWVQDYHLMLLPLMLRTLIEGSEQQGATSQRELEHVRHGVDGTLQLQDDDLLAAPSAYDSLRGNGRINTPPADDGEGEGDDQGDYQGRDAALRSNSSATGRGLGTSDGSSGRGSIKIGFFLHTPFPSSEIYRILPVRREILLGILHCDLIGFHTYDYARHFLSSCTRILGLPTMPNGAEFEGRYVHVGTYPIGIEPSQFEDGLERESVKERIKSLQRRFEGVKIIVGVDRLDYIKGVPQKLHALETFLQDHPEWIGKVVLVQVAVPSRQDVEEYQNLRATVNEAVGRINGRFGTVESMPIHFLHRSVSFDELCALYAISDACLVTSTRDGMNLVSYEYIACQQQRAGVMILSEFAGAAQSLNGSLICNPWDAFAVSDAIHEALTMPANVRRENFEKLSRYVKKHTASWWGLSFVNDLKRIKVEGEAESPSAGVPSLPSRP
ncbi:putative alpha,alpha-trehalose-phosphate synthase (UDP-forming) [Mycosarcoma maydis]|uniref:alpha,alpha-trehalose-phosphate synthase (UDP-forming) n=1 Tax=Mycosarcoma maydis TaxID=5270 RepID=A0A0D1CGC1_MYCMD|nr:putative alpha,alpha-trehalose-phosphate synthase (UDP-forming) [Ustilago maydis 521]KIS72007.1 putative alpha,alpha-trehalose-phosphate synthase (UDP-forming) [Ustilago maydis 521]|eukprot:XP_011386301.1 putative alpha,alpha-trehalose-phosphate synthase (UDP-forming) [Ustilago maydis 521]